MHEAHAEDFHSGKEATITLGGMKRVDRVATLVQYQKKKVETKQWQNKLAFFFFNFLTKKMEEFQLKTLNVRTPFFMNNEPCKVSFLMKIELSLFINVNQQIFVSKNRAAEFRLFPIFSKINDVLQ